MTTQPEDAAPGRSELPGWWLTGLLVVAAVLGLWWANQQQQSLQEQMGSSFEVSGGGWMLWSLTLAVVGTCLGLAVAAAAGWRGRISYAGLAWVVVPLAPIVMLHLWFAGVISALGPITRQVTSISTQVACAIAVGLFAAGWFAPLLLRSPSPGDA